MDETTNSRQPGRKPLQSVGSTATAIGAFLMPLLLLASVWEAAAQQELPVVSVAKPVARDIVEDDEFVGRFEAVDEVDIRARVSGYLSEVHFQDGAVVNKGDLLFTIDRRPYQAAFDAAKSRVDVATSLLQFTQMQLERAEALAKSGNLAVSILDDRRRRIFPHRPSCKARTQR